MRRTHLAFLIGLLAVSSLSIAYAFTVSNQFGTSLTVTSPLQVFSDNTCTTPFGGTISLPSGIAGGSSYKDMYVKNAGGSPLTVNWNSTIPHGVFPPDTGVSDYWYLLPQSALDGAVLTAGQCAGTRYVAYIGLHAPQGPYSWSVELGYA